MSTMTKFLYRVIHVGMRLQRRLNGINTVFFLIFVIPSNSIISFYFPKRHFPKGDFPIDNFPSANFPNVRFSKRQLPKGQDGGQVLGARMGQRTERCGQNIIGKFPLRKLYSWEVAHWENAVGKLPLGKKPLGKQKETSLQNCQEL